MDPNKTPDPDERARASIKDAIRTVAGLHDTDGADRAADVGPDLPSGDAQGSGDPSGDQGEDR